MTKEEKMYEAPDGTMLTYEEFQELCRELKAQELAGMVEPGSSSWSDEEVIDRMNSVMSQSDIDELYAKFTPTDKSTIVDKLVEHLNASIGADSYKMKQDGLKLHFYDIKKTKEFDFTVVVAFAPVMIRDDVAISIETLRIGSNPTIFEHVVTLDIGKHVFGDTCRRKAIQNYMEEN
ncbi:hypothetical protein [Aeromonas caviae]